MASHKDSGQIVGAPDVHSVLALGSLTHVGLKRSANQDDFCAILSPNSPSGSDALLAVADGMGGHQAGEVASRMVIRGLIGKLAKLGGSGTWPGGLGAVLQRTIGDINSEVHSASRRPETRGMGTTLTAAVLMGNTLTIGHVGDSRAYLLRDGNLTQLTQDHSWVAEQVARGAIRPEDAERHPRRNILTRAIGVDARVHVDATSIEVREGDVLLICSDGLHSLVTDGEIKRALTKGSPQLCSQGLVDLANAKGGNDNITVIVTRIEGFSPSTGATMAFHDMATILSGGALTPGPNRALLIAARIVLFPIWGPWWLVKSIFRLLSGRGR